MLGSKDHARTLRLPIAIGLRVANVRRAAGFYEQIGFRFVMAVPAEDDEWLLCLLKYGSGSLLLGAIDHPRFPRASRLGGVRHGPSGLTAAIDLGVPDLGATYAACVAAACEITAEPALQVSGDRSFSCVDPFGYQWRFTEAERGTFDQSARAARGVWS